MTHRRTSRLLAVAAGGLLIGLSGAPLAHAAPAAPCSDYAEGCDDGGVVIERPDGEDGVDSVDDGETGGSDGGTGGGAGGTGGGAGGGTSSAGGPGSAPESLPLTGGEATLLALSGAGAVAGGAALLVASRRRRPA